MQPANANYSRKVRFADPATLSRYGEECFLQDLDIVINSTGTGTLGRIGMFTTSMLGTYPCIVPDSHVTVVRISRKQLSSYVTTFLRSDYGQGLIFSKQTGSTNQKELPTKEISSFLIPIPPEKELGRIKGVIAETSTLLNFL